MLNQIVLVGQLVQDPEIKELENTDEVDEDNEDMEERKTVDIKDTYTNTYGSVTVKNLTSIKLTKDILKPDYNVKNKKDIIIYHTHTCESYTPTKKNSYKASGNFRTTDLNYSVVRVGKELEAETLALYVKMQKLQEATGNHRFIYTIRKE